MRQSEFKKKCDHDTGKYTRQHIYGEGISDKVRSFGTKAFRRKTKKQVKFAPPPPPPPPPPKTTKKAGDKIVKMRSKPPAKKTTTPKKMTQQDINNRVLQIMSGGKII